MDWTALWQRLATFDYVGKTSLIYHYNINQTWKLLSGHKYLLMTDTIWASAPQQLNLSKYLNAYIIVVWAIWIKFEDLTGAEQLLSGLFFWFYSTITVLNRLKWKPNRMLGYDDISDAFRSFPVLALEILLIFYYAEPTCTNYQVPHNNKKNEYHLHKHNFPSRV